MAAPRNASVLLILAIGMSAGCRMSVPVHVWQPALLQSTVGKRIAVAPIAGPEPLAENLRERLVSSAPRDAGRQMEIADVTELSADEWPVRLASASEDDTSDLTLASIARRQGFEFILHGAVINEPGHKRTGNTGGSVAQDELVISWSLTDLSGNQSPVGTPWRVELDSLTSKYPDLAFFADREDAIAEGAARETFRLFAPAVVQEKVPIAIAYLTPGSRAVRQGNAYALAGQWSRAEQIWAETARRYPSQSAAVLNLAVAAVAAQDFSRAKQLARQAVRRHPTKLASQTLAWVELMQRQYHEAFEIPEPPEGWFLTRTEFDTTARESVSAPAE